MRRPAACAAAALLAAAALPAGAGDLSAIRLYPAAEYTRLVVEADVLPGYRLAILEGPDRLVLDVSASDSDELLDAVRNRDLSGAPYLRDIRAARFDGDRLRVVFDLSGEVTYSLFSLDPVQSYGSRVVLDISPRGGSGRNVGLLSDLGFTSVAPDPGRPAPESAGDFHVMIDPGHGGEDPGAVNKDGVREKHIVLDISRRLERRLGRVPGVRASMTRRDDVFIPLATRIRMAQERDVDLFVSIHADSFTSSRPRGASVFVLSRKGASSRLAAQLAEHANLSDQVGGINSAAGAPSTEVERALTDIFKDGKERASRSYAEIALERLGSINHTHGDHVHSAGFAVLKSPSVPSVLIEVGFLSNPDDARLLTTSGYRQRLAEQIALAIIEYKVRNEPVAQVHDG